jgi:hypothetical protein
MVANLGSLKPAFSDGNLPINGDLCVRMPGWRRGCRPISPAGLLYARQRLGIQHKHMEPVFRKPVVFLGGNAHDRSTQE